MIVFVLFQYPPGTHQGDGMFSGVFSSFHLAKYGAGGEEAWRAHWDRCSIDTQAENEAWSYDVWEIHMVEVDVSCDGTKIVLKQDIANPKN